MRNRKEILELLDEAVELAQASQAKALQAKILLDKPESNITVLGFEIMPDAELKDYVSVREILRIVERVKSNMNSGRCSSIPFIKEIRATYNSGLKESYEFQKWVQSSDIYDFTQV